MKKTTWNTYAERAYTHDVANDPSSQGGVHLHQVRLAKAGWQKRIKQASGGCHAYGPVTPVSDAEGESFFATAQQAAR